MAGAAKVTAKEIPSPCPASEYVFWSPGQARRKKILPLIMSLVFLPESTPQQLRGRWPVLQITYTGLKSSWPSPQHHLPGTLDRIPISTAQGRSLSCLFPSTVPTMTHMQAFRASYHSDLLTEAASQGHLLELSVKSESVPQPKLLWSLPRLTTLQRIYLRSSSAYQRLICSPSGWCLCCSNHSNKHNRGEHSCS